MRAYRNRETGITITVASECHGDQWEEILTEKAAKPAAKKAKKAAKPAEESNE